jgi:hypothetical protein
MRAPLCAVPVLVFCCVLLWLRCHNSSTTCCCSCILLRPVAPHNCLCTFQATLHGHVVPATSASLPRCCLLHTQQHSWPPVHVTDSSGLCAAGVHTVHACKHVHTIACMHANTCTQLHACKRMHTHTCSVLCWLGAGGEPAGLCHVKHGHGSFSAALPCTFSQRAPAAGSCAPPPARRTQKVPVAIAQVQMTCCRAQYCGSAHMLPQPLPAIRRCQPYTGASCSFVS